MAAQAHTRRTKNTATRALAAAAFALTPATTANALGPACQGGDPFTPLPFLNTGDLSEDLRLAHLNTDGHIDAVIVNNNTSTLTVLLGNGDGTFNEITPPVPTATNPSSVFVADLNNDSLPDLAITGENLNATDGELAIHLGDGTGNFPPVAPANLITVGRRPSTVIAADLNNDSFPDLAVSNDFDDDVTILLGDGTGTFQPAGQNIEVGDRPASITAVDLNNDNIPDLITANFGSSNLTPVINSPPGTFTPATDIPLTSGSAPRYIAAAELNNDALPDLAIANRDSNNVTILLANPAGGFIEQPPIGTGTQREALDIADLDDDGNQDIVTANRDTDSISVFFGNGNGSFSPEITFPLGEPPSTPNERPFSVDTADLNGDGATDIVALNRAGVAVSGIRAYINSIGPAAFWNGLAGTLFSDPGNWQDGAVPSLNAPTIAVFDSTVEPTFPPSEIISLNQNTSIRGFLHANNNINFDLDGAWLSILGTETNAGPIALNLGVEQCDGSSALPQSPPSLRFANTNPAATAVIDAQTATVGDAGPASLEIDASAGPVTLIARQGLTVGDAGVGFLEINGPNAALLYGSSASTLDNITIARNSTAFIDADAASIFALGPTDTLTIAHAPGINADINLQNASNWSHTGNQITLANAGSADLNIESGSAFLTNVAEINLASLQNSNASVRVTGAGSRWADPGAELRVAGQGNAEVRIDNGGSLQFFAITNTANGTIRGDGTIDATLDNFGLVRVESPTLPAATLTIQGEYSQFDDPLDPRFSGTLSLNLATAGPGLLQVNDDANLAGTLVANTDGPFDPPAGAQFTVLTADQLNDRFDVAFLPNLDGRFLSVTYDTTSTPNAVNLLVNTLNNDVNLSPTGSAGLPGEPTDATLADLNNDGFIDLAITLPDPANPTTANGSVIIFYNDGNSGPNWQGFGEASTIQQIFTGIGVLPDAITAADLDADNDLDLVVANRGTPGDQIPGTVTVLTNTPNASGAVPGVANPFGVAQVTTLNAGDEPRGAAVANLNGDNIPDIAVISGGATSLLTIFNGAAPPPGRDRPWHWTPSRTTGDDFDIPDDPLSVEPGDFDANLATDELVIVSAAQSVATLVRITPLRTTEILPPINLGQGARQVITADFNLDGLTDFATVNSTSRTVSSVLNNNQTPGDINFKPTTNLPVTPPEISPLSIAAADLDQDGDPDIALVTEGDPNINEPDRLVRTLRNDLDQPAGQLAFAAPTAQLTTGLPVIVLAGDVNQDNADDLVTVGPTPLSPAPSPRNTTPDQVSTLLTTDLEPCLADTNGSGDVGLEDLLIVLAAFGNTTIAGPAGGDLDNSGTVGLEDLLTVLSEFGNDCP